MRQKQLQKMQQKCLQNNTKTDTIVAQKIAQKMP